MPVLLDDARPVARKPHGCNACLGVIAAGDTYERQRVADGSEIWTWKAHLLCGQIVLHLDREAGYSYSDHDEAPDPLEVQWVIGDLLGGLLGNPPHDD